MSLINVIALNTFKENIRNRVLYVIVAIALLLIGFALFLGDWSVFNSEYVIKSFTLSVLSISGLLLSIFIGVGLVQNEIKKKTIHTILAKPVGRTQFIIGKYIGLLYILICHVLILSAAFAFILLISDAGASLGLVYGVVLKGVEMALIIAIALFFSTFSSPALSSFFTFAIYVAGHTLPEVLKQIEFAKKIESQGYSSFQESIARFLHTVLPDLSLFDRSSEIVHQMPVDGFSVLITIGYGALYITLFIIASAWWFSRKEFI